MTSSLLPALTVHTVLDTAAWVLGLAVIVVMAGLPLLELLAGRQR